VSVRVVHLDTTLEPAWERFAASHPDAGIYHTLAWKRVTEEGLGHRALYQCAVNERGEVLGILPLFEVTGLFGRRLVSLPMRDRGSVVARDDATAAALVDAAVAVGTQRRAGYLELRALDPPSPSVLGDRPWELRRSWVATRIDLTPGVDAIWKGLDKNSLRWSIRRAEKNGVEIVQDPSVEGMRLFHRLFVRTRCSMGIPPFPYSLFQAIHTHVIAPGLGQLLIARVRGEPVHGLISLYSKDTFVPAYAAPQNAFRKLYGNERILWTSIEWAARNGFRVYDFGADSERQEGLLFFKGRWNGVQHRMAYLVLPLLKQPPDFDSSGPRYERIRAIWRRLPLAVAEPLGGWVTRQLS